MAKALRIAAFIIGCPLGAAIGWFVAGTTLNVGLQAVQNRGMMLPDAAMAVVLGIMSFFGGLIFVWIGRKTNPVRGPVLLIVYVIVFVVVVHLAWWLGAPLVLSSGFWLGFFVGALVHLRGRLWRRAKAYT